MKDWIHLVLNIFADIWFRLRNSDPLVVAKMMMTSLTRKAFLRRPWIRLSLTACSSMSCWVCATPYGSYNQSNLLMCIPTGLQQEQPQLYENLTKILNAEEQQVLQAVFHEADAKAMAAANAQAAAAAAGMTTNGQ